MIGMYRSLYHSCDNNFVRVIVQVCVVNMIYNWSCEHKAGDKYDD